MTKPEILAIIIGAFTTVAGWFVGRRSRVAKAAVTEIEVTERAIIIWRTLAQDLKKEVDELRGIVDELRTENQKLQVEVRHLTERLK